MSSLPPVNNQKVQVTKSVVDTLGPLREAAEKRKAAEEHKAAAARAALERRQVAPPAPLNNVITPRAQLEERADAAIPKETRVPAARESKKVDMAQQNAEEELRQIKYLQAKHKTELQRIRNGESQDTLSSYLAQLEGEFTGIKSKSMTEALAKMYDEVEGLIFEEEAQALGKEWRRGLKMVKTFGGCEQFLAELRLELQKYKNNDYVTDVLREINKEAATKKQELGEEEAAAAQKSARFREQQEKKAQMEKAHQKAQEKADQAEQASAERLEKCWYQELENLGTSAECLLFIRNRKTADARHPNQFVRLGEIIRKAQLKAGILEKAEIAIIQERERNAAAYQMQQTAFLDQQQLQAADTQWQQWNNELNSYITSAECQKFVVTQQSLLQKYQQPGVCTNAHVIRLLGHIITQAVSKVKQLAERETLERGNQEAQAALLIQQQQTQAQQLEQQWTDLINKTTTSVDCQHWLMDFQRNLETFKKSSFTNPYLIPVLQKMIPIAENKVKELAITEREVQQASPTKKQQEEAKTQAQATQPVVPGLEVIKKLETKSTPILINHASLIAVKKGSQDKCQKLCKVIIPLVVLLFGYVFKEEFQKYLSK